MPVAIDSTGPSTVTATINYAVAPANGRAYFHINADPVTGKRDINYRHEEHNDIEIENVRGKEDQYTLDNAGFQWFKSPVKFTAFENDALVEKEYYAESIELLKKLTGASKVVIFDNTIRRHRPGQVGDTPQTRQPVFQAHVDQTTKASIARVHRHLPADEVPGLLEKRFQIINLWRPIKNVAWEWPLALCDYRSVNPETDTLPIALIYPDREGETYGIKHNLNHKWKYLKGMTPDEVVLIKCFDSLQDGSVAVFTPHTGFVDPTTPADAPRRESIELRALEFLNDVCVILLKAMSITYSMKLIMDGLRLVTQCQSLIHTITSCRNRGHEKGLAIASEVQSKSKRLATACRHQTDYPTSASFGPTVIYDLAQLSSAMATEVDDSAADTITASINYVVAPSDGAPAYLKPKHIDPVTGLKGAQNYTLEAKEVAIENVRGKESEFTLDNAGFQWVIGAPSKHTSFDNDLAIEKEYWPECIQYIKAVTGASKVVIYDHTVRRNYPVEEGGYKHGKPVAHVHGDQTPKAATARVHRHLPASEAPGLLERRFQIINMWRPIKHAALEWPLALCDYRSLDVEKDLFPLALIYPKRSGETYAVRYNPNHKWRYLRGMSPADFVLIKNFDNLQDGTVARLSLHTAFIDPTTPVNTPPRESIELRALVFYN